MVKTLVGLCSVAQIVAEERSQTRTMLEDTYKATTVSISPKQLEALKTVQKYMEQELHITLSKSRVVERLINLYLLEITREQG
jgi:hypothetical protein